MSRNDGRAERVTSLVDRVARGRACGQAVGQGGISVIGGLAREPIVDAYLPRNARYTSTPMQTNNHCNTSKIISTIQLSRTIFMQTKNLKRAE